MQVYPVYCLFLSRSLRRSVCLVYCRFLSRSLYRCALCIVGFCLDRCAGVPVYCRFLSRLLCRRSVPCVL